MMVIASERTAADTRRIQEWARYEIRKRGRFWEVIDSEGELVCMTVYKRGAKEVVRRLGQ